MHEYRHAQGTVVYRIVREECDGAKKLIAERPDGRGVWLRGIKGVPHVLYRLPEVLAADPRKTVVVVEGEKCADRLWEAGFVATTNPFGAGKWQDDHSAALAGRDVVLIPDNDDAGRTHAMQAGVVR